MDVKTRPAVTTLADTNSTAPVAIHAQTSAIRPDSGSGAGSGISTVQASAVQASAVQASAVQARGAADKKMPSVWRAGVNLPHRFDKSRIVRLFNDYSGRIFSIALRTVSTAVLLLLAALVLSVLSLVGWLYGVWQNRRVSGMPAATGLKKSKTEVDHAGFIIDAKKLVGVESKSAPAMQENRSI